jgi:hypothetical protein
MVSLAKALVGLAAVALVLAVVTNFMGEFLTTAEGYARASMALALIAIALVVCFRDTTLT